VSGPGEGSFEEDRGEGDQPDPSVAGNGVLSGHALLAKLSWALRSDPGKVRDHNEDCAGAFAPTIPDDAWDRGPVFVVCDGLGGHAAGEVASRTAVDALIGAWTTGTPGAPHAALRSAVRQANLTVYDAAQEKGKRGMSTTCTALTLAGREAIVAHVGDSRCYLVRDDEVSLITTDHSRVGEMLRAGLLSPEQAANHPARSMITRAVGTDPIVQVDLVRQPTSAGDTFVLCSDGLWDVVARHEIGEIAAGIGTTALPTVVDATERLVDLALERGTPDNVTVLVVRVTTDRPIPAAGGRRGLFRRGRK
jgi:PPM family protein phosphatase